MMEEEELMRIQWRWQRFYLLLLSLLAYLQRNGGELTFSSFLEYPVSVKIGEEVYAVHVCPAHGGTCILSWAATIISFG